MKTEIRKMIESLAKSHNVEIKIDDDSISMSPDQFLRLAMIGGEDGEEEEEEEKNGNGGPKKPPRRIDPELIKKTIKALDGEASSQEIREAILESENMRIPPLTLRQVLQKMIDDGEITSAGKARGKMYLLKPAPKEKKKGGGK